MREKRQWNGKGVFPIVQDDSIALSSLGCGMTTLLQALWDIFQVKIRYKFKYLQVIWLQQIQKQKEQIWWHIYASILKIQNTGEKKIENNQNS